MWRRFGPIHSNSAWIIPVLLAGPYVVEDLRYGNAFDRAGAARQFSLYGDASAVAIPLLARMLEDPDPIAAQAAADALVRIGPRASLAVQAMLNSPKAPARLRALLVLSQMRTSYF